MRKKTFAVVFAVVMVVSSLYAVPIKADTTSYASEGYYIPISPLWQNIAGINIILSFNNGRGTMTGSVVGNTGTTSISVNATLERENPNGTHTYIVSFNNLEAEGNLWTWERVHHVARGHYYRLTFDVTAVRHGVSETVSVSNTRRAN